VLAGALVLAACSGGGTSGSSASTTAGGASDTTATTATAGADSGVTLDADGRLVPAPCDGSSNTASEDDGVSEDTVNVAALGIDFATLAQIGFAATELSLTDVTNTFIEAANADGGVCGRTIDLQQVEYDVLAGDAGAACVQVTEDRANLLVSSSSFDQPTCITDAGVPLVATSDVTAADLDTSGGLLLARTPAVEAQYRATVEYAEAHGLLDGKVGVFYGNLFPNLSAAVENVVLPALDDLGVDHVDYRSDTAGPSDPEGNAILTSAATDFVAQGVDTVLLFVGPTNQTGMQAELHAQGLDPTYLSAPVAGNTSNEIFADRFGTRDFTTGQQWVTYSLGPSELDDSDPLAASCNERYAELTGTPSAAPRTFDYQVIGTLCVQVDEILAALSIAGGDLNRQSIVDALQSLPPHHSPGLLGEIAWTPEVHTAEPVFSALTYDGASNTVTSDTDTFTVGP
jgi:ABC-type branched-subunit amino acid transport system substrate-binding protein